MMGSPFYYNVYVPSDMAIGDVFHDCMWSGVCACCQEPEINGTTTVVVKPLNPRSEQEDRYRQEMFNYAQPAAAAALPLAATSATTTTTTTTTLMEHETVKVIQPPKPKEIPTKFTSSISKSKTNHLAIKYTNHYHQQQQQQQFQAHNAQHCDSATRSTASSGSGSSSCSGDSAVSVVTTHRNGDQNSSVAAKKLRHREVEKNRHRQLQAMVKTLSEKIPGRVDKETQVQTMRRAARYCVFLRDILAAVAHGRMTGEKMEKIYLRSCDNVELIMAQQC